MRTIEDALILAAKFHKGQLDKDNLPYIYHPVYVMGMLDINDTDGRIVALLHDVVEDTECTLGYLKKQGFCECIIDGIDSITKRSYESYDKYIGRVKLNKIGRRVKLADSGHNFTRSKLNYASPKDEKDKAKALKRINKYSKVLESLS